MVEQNSLEEEGIVSGNVALIIIYNHHQHADNIPVLEKMYGERFSHIYHLVPTMPGFAPVAHEIGPNVISVHGRSYCFQGWMAQGLPQYFREEYTHYFFIHDDLILNPGFNENNFREYLELDEEDTAFLADLYVLHQRLEWDFALEAWSFKGRVDPLPAYEEALKRFSAHGLAIKPISFYWSLLTHGYYVHPADSFCQQFVVLREWLKIVLQRLERLVTWPASKRTLAYPLVGGYSDIVVIPAGNIKEFCRYCEALAALNLFVATAVPTALALSCKKINTHKNILRRGRYRWRGTTWQLVRSRYDDGALGGLLENFPDECLFMHPVKLSQWK